MFFFLFGGRLLSVFWKSRAAEAVNRTEHQV